MSSEVPEPPWRERKQRRPPRSTLSRDAIVDAALRVLDRDGFDALTMRALAKELNTGPGALYWHVANKEELLQLMIDRVAGELELPEPDPSRWQEQLKEMAREMRRTMGRHPGIARATMGRIPLGPNTARWAEWLFALLRPAGIPDRAAARVGDLIALYTGAYAFEESLPFPNPGGDEASLQEFVGMMRDYFAGLPPDRFPNTVELADELVSGDRDERFEFGLDVLVKGLATQAGP